MKKLIATAVAAGALAVSGAASAQDFGNILLNILGLGAPTYNYGNNYPGVVAGQQIYQDQYGRQFYYDQYGRQVHINNYNNNTARIVGYDQYGRPVYNNSGAYAYGGSSWDHDGDGVANSRDRWPNDPRYR
jgi:hypothetical protein